MDKTFGKAPGATSERLWETARLTQERAVSHTGENDPDLRKLVGTAGFEPATP